MLWIIAVFREQHTIMTLLFFRYVLSKITGIYAGADRWAGRCETICEKSNTSARRTCRSFRSANGRESS